MPTQSFVGISPTDFECVAGGGLSSPGGQFRLTSTYNSASAYSFEITEDDANAPTYASLVSQTYDPDIANSLTGTANDDSLSGGIGNDQLYGWHGNDTFWTVPAQTR